MPKVEADVGRVEVGGVASSRLLRHAPLICASLEQAKIYYVDELQKGPAGDVSGAVAQAEAQGSSRRGEGMHLPMCIAR
jgi:hypothetical protein